MSDLIAVEIKPHGLAILKSKRARVYRKGDVVRSVAELELWLDQQRYVFFHDKPLHPSFVMSWQFNTLRNYVRRGWLRYALTNKPEEMR